MFICLKLWQRKTSVLSDKNLPLLGANNQIKVNQPIIWRSCNVCFENFSNIGCSIKEIFRLKKISNFSKKFIFVGSRIRISTILNFEKVLFWKNFQMLHEKSKWHYRIILNWVVLRRYKQIITSTDRILRNV